MGGSIGSNALMIALPAEKIQLLSIDLFDDDALFPALSKNPAERTAAVSARNQKAVDGAAGPQCLHNGIAPDNQVCLRSGFWLLHIAIPPLILYNICYYTTFCSGLTAKFFLSSAFATGNIYLKKEKENDRIS